MTTVMMRALCFFAMFVGGSCLVADSNTSLLFFEGMGVSGRMGVLGPASKLRGAVAVAVAVVTLMSCAG